jgi:polysaccharide deacetylase family protein (PEP-CTERM system associated)
MHMVATTLHCLSFDVEEHFQVSAFESPMRRQRWDQFESRVERNTSRVLELLASGRCRATFFVLGWVAERYPNMVKDIASAGHEVASHGFSHELVTSQTPRAFREDVRKAKLILEDILSQPIHGYRAPSFTITKRSIWALPILVEEGYAYDSSVFPVFHDRYGMPTAERTVHRIMTESGALWEVPPSTTKLFNVRVPVAGGGYFRLFPYPIFRQLIRRVEKEGIPLVMYFHPWELDPQQPKMGGAILSRFRHYLNLHKTEMRLQKLLQEFRFAPIHEAIEVVRETCRKNMAKTPSETGPFWLDGLRNSETRD